nr:MAG: hypothetical protein J07AB56_10270 [Candidatus Nanosalinarum sp. J07AB56]
MSKAYLKGILHDGTEREYTYRISQKNEELIEKIVEMVEDLGFDAWTYEEGDRGVYVVEFSKKAVDGLQIRVLEEKREYVRGYFDAEGGVPQNTDARFYIYSAQKNKADLEEVKSFVEDLEIETGDLHRPSRESRPNYWRFYIPVSSHNRFANEVGSRHPDKEQALEHRAATPQNR